MAKKIDFRLLLDRLTHISFDISAIKRYAWVFHLLIIFLVAKSVSNIIISYLDEKIEAPTTKSQSTKPKLAELEKPIQELGTYSVITRRNIFNPKAKEEELIEPLKGGKVGLDETGAVPTSLPYELIGTIILSDAARSVFAMSNKDKNEVESYRVGEVIDQAAKVFKIAPSKVYFENIQTGQLEYIELKEEKGADLTVARSEISGTGVNETAPGRFTIDRGALESTLQNPNEILVQARAVPNIVGGKIQGFRLFAIQPGSIYEKLGIKNGDIILQINDVALDSPAKALEFYGAISSATDISLDIDRNGQKQSYHYTIK